MPTSELDVRENVPLAPYTTLRIGGPARFFCEVTTEAALVEAVRFARKRNLPLFVLGGGSNLLVGDSGFDGVVVHMAVTAPMISTRAGDVLQVTTAAGNDWNAFVIELCEQGISGVECLAGIPGTVGGTPVQNVGAYGQEVASTITEVRAFDLEAFEFVTLSHEQCRFAYRSSIFNTTQRGRYIVSQVSFRFDTGATPSLAYADLQRHFGDRQSPPTALEVYHAVREIRYGKGMLIVEGEADCRSAGSFFKNPVVSGSHLLEIATELDLSVDKVPHWPAGKDLIKLPAAWLLEWAGFAKGYQLGEAGISSRHTLALVNRGHASFADVAALRDTIQREVYRRFKIQLEQEPVQLGV